jgi:hypothetical protein
MRLAFIDKVGTTLPVQRFLYPDRGKEITGHPVKTTLVKII